MKRTMMIVVLLLNMVTQTQAQVKPFVKAGVGTSEYWLENAEGTSTRFSYAVGAGVDIPFKGSRFGLSPSLLFISKGAELHESEGVETDMGLSYLEVPIDVYYRLPLGEKWGLRFSAGPYFGYGVGGKSKVTGGRYPKLKVDTFDDDDVNHFDCGLNLGFQACYKRWFIGVENDLGFLPVHKKQNGEAWPSNLSSIITIGLYF
jgi:hypothetical protein